MVLTLALQIGMLPLMARDFHRVTLAAPLVNLAAVPLTGVVVPLGFVTLGTALLFPALARMLAAPLAAITLALLRIVHWFAHLPRWSYRIPTAPLACGNVFHVRTSVGGEPANCSSMAKKNHVGIGHGIVSVLAGYRVISVFPGMVGRKAGAERAGRGTRRFFVRRVSGRENTADRRGWRVRRLRRTD